MAYLFQNFVFNFLRKEQVDYKAKMGEHIDWPAEAIDSERCGDLKYLPTMETDICLRSPDRTLIISQISLE